MLNSSDRLFAELRDASFAAVGPRLGEKAKLIQSSYQGSKVCSSPEAIRGGSSPQTGRAAQALQ